MGTTASGSAGSENPEGAARRVSSEAALQVLLSRGRPGTDPTLLHGLVRHVAEVFGVTSAVLVRQSPGEELLHPLALWSRGQYHEEPAVTPQGSVLDEVLRQDVFHCPEDAHARFPEDGWPRRLGPQGVLGMSVRNSREEVLGALVLMHDEPLKVAATDLAWLRAFTLLASTSLEHLQTRAELDEARDFLHKTLNAIQKPVFVKDREHRFVLTNEAFCRFVGTTEEKLLGRSDHDFVPHHEADLFWQQDERVFTSGQSNENEETYTDGARGIRTLITLKASFTSARGQPFLVGVIRDVSEHKRMEAHLRMADRMVTVGTLAASVAHEINNPLSYVNASLNFLREQLAQEDTTRLSLEELREAVSDALEGMGRVRTIVQDLKTFARADDERAEPMDIHQVIGSALRMVRHQLQEHARWELELEPVPQVLGNPARLGQVLVNLLVNALQAFVQSNPKRNRIRIASRVSDTGQVMVEVEDNGRGMGPEVLARLFTPFFTTKPTGEGSGLGLNISQSIIQAMGGRIEVSSTPGQGSTFRLLLPRLSHQEPDLPSGA
ncbi:PAS domain-containing sensor histidine kinase [Cystobacter fuscus]|uniref:histidine kinase n=1 Tax=Cystobacter fuscus TaxID=43 RepID=A0A250J9U5_9BACT|nr:PAS domain-containing sensor histidine kinase [Cystobacter fuscus]